MKIQIANIINESRTIRIDPIDSKIKMRDYYKKKRFVNKFDNLDEMDKFFKIQHNKVQIVLYLLKN